MKLTRRELLLGAGGGVAGVRATSSKKRPHYVVIVVLHGGADAVLTVDAKDAREPDLDIETGYNAGERVAGKKRLYGPMIGDLLRHEEDLTLIHGVRSDTVSHEDGMLRLQRAHVRIAPSTRLLGDVLGDVLPGTAPVPFVEFCPVIDQHPLGPRGWRTPAPRIDAGVAAMIYNSPEPAFAKATRASAIAEEYRLSRAEVIFSADPSHLHTVSTALRNTAALRRFLGKLDRTRHFSDTPLGNGLGLALQAIERNFAKCSFVSSRMVAFDTHNDNLRRQKSLLPVAHADLARFFDLLKRKKNAHGTLFEQTTVMISCGEVGRYPKLNAAQGKDHWSENSVILAGRGLKKEPGGVTLGATNPRYQGVKVDYRSGRADGVAARHVFIDAVGATLVKIAGGDPSAAGFHRDDVLEYVL